MKSYGPKLTAEQKEEMRTKKYPNMMSPEGTFTHWFFNNKVIHLWITMVCIIKSNVRLRRGVLGDSAGSIAPHRTYFLHDGLMINRESSSPLQSPPGTWTSCRKPSTAS